MYSSLVSLSLFLLANAQTLPAGVTLVPLSAECQTFINNSILPQLNICTNQKATSIQDYVNLNPAGTSAASFCTEACVNAQKAALSALQASPCNTAPLATIAQQSFTLNDAVKVFQASFAVVCTPTANNQDYCVNYQGQAWNKDTITKVTAGALPTAVFCTECVQRQLAAVGNVPNLPSYLDQYVVAAQLSLKNLCKNTGFSVVEGKGPGVGVTSSKIVSSSAFGYSALSVFVVALVYVF